MLETLKTLFLLCLYSNFINRPINRKSQCNLQSHDDQIRYCNPLTNKTNYVTSRCAATDGNLILGVYFSYLAGIVNFIECQAVMKRISALVAFAILYYETHLNKVTSED